MRRTIGILYILLLSFSLAAQVGSQTSVKYSPDFKFEDGFYLNFSMVKQNSPIPVARIITNLDRSSSDFYTNLLNEKLFTYFDGNGVKQQTSTSKLWGFSRNGVLYIKMSEGFHRITIVGGICHFVATIVSYENPYYDPYFGNPYSYSSRRYMPYSSTQGRATKNQEVSQFLLDFETGETYEYELKAVEILLMKDTQLYDEYMALKKKKKKQLKFYYIRKFNERNPIYFPVKNKF
ncbi:MAG: hypothetical protein K9H49_07140 [Bacteroidales bacterium]|nr:hypothetical protein [Bacteroidales bacterium]MCF8391979.1 hypothetical protein [Bacteroidales bacterium]